MFGLFGLLSSFQLLGRNKDLHLYAPGRISEIMEFYMANFAPENNFNIIIHPLGTKRKKVIYRDEWVEVLSFPLNHRIPACGYLFREIPQELNLKKEALLEYKPGVENIHKIRKGADFVLPDGRIIKNEEFTLPPWECRSYAYCSDTSYKPSIAEIVKNTDLLYHESTFSHKDSDLASQTNHSTAKQAAMIAKMSNAKKLLLGHFSPRYQDLSIMLEEAKTVFENSVLVNDGDEYSVERVRRNYRDQ
jgi:ribonuclease Z